MSNAIADVKNKILLDEDLKMLVRAVVHTDKLQEELQKVAFPIKDVIINISKHINAVTISIQGERTLDVKVIFLKVIELNKSYAFRLPVDKIMHLLSCLSKGQVASIEYNIKTEMICVTSYNFNTQEFFIASTEDY
jgi:hypothetical protein